VSPPETISAYVLCATAPGQERQVAEELRGVDGVLDAHTVYGNFDVVAYLESRDLPTLEAAIKRIRKIGHVRRTMTLITD
jgi:DNA-binding Lrp family transcriptional regulator